MSVAEAARQAGVSERTIKRGIRDGSIPSTKVRGRRVVLVVRFRPMSLTAMAVIVGSAVMLAGPIFQGLAIALMAGAVAATLLSRYAVPVLYLLLARRGRAAELQRKGALEASGQEAEAQAA